jgi:multiple sugar transport system ATP-binding protein
MNMIPGTARTNGATAHVAFADGATLPLPPNARAQDGQPVLYGIRPEHCAVGSDNGLRWTSSSSSPPAPTLSCTADSTDRK